MLLFIIGFVFLTLYLMKRYASSITEKYTGLTLGKFIAVVFAAMFVLGIVVSLYIT